MKKHILVAAAMTHIALVYPFRFTTNDIKQGASEVLYTSAIPARVISWAVFNDKEAANRYIKHAQFYAKKSDRTWISDNIVDHVYYPVVDTLVGFGMSKANKEIESIHTVTENISENNRKFIANNVQLITSSVIVQSIRLEYDNENGITRQDIKNFGKCCAAQVGCDVVDEFLVKPAVEAYVGDINSWTASIVRGLGNYVLAQIVINKVSKY